ncbi:glycosyltransferase [Microcella sp.]|uniref:glycosyltransferase n=1 Tax=Microcella sp. TaxID=1913979 RepID=UPI00255E28C8|nr:glycosyltransferase [Microcella sp.]MBX9472729.1 glycosyltransferase [Microcella sp.]
MTSPRRALIVVYSRIVSDPRVRRQIDWLTAEGWQVDTVGLGEHPTPAVDEHWPIADLDARTASRWGSISAYLLTPRRAAYRRLMADRIPAAASAALRDGAYDLIIANDLEFVPWLTERATFGAAGAPRIHLDLHEVFTEYHKPGLLWRVLTAGYRHWVRRQLADPVFTTRSTVAGGIAELYRDKLGLEGMAVIRNSPELVDQSPRPVDPHNIRLLYHGLADYSRGIGDILAAVPLLDERYTMTFMLTGFDANIAAIRADAQSLGDRVRFVPPVAMTDIATAINGFDLEVMVYRPASANLVYALPNKLFEATQGRLGLVIGRSPMMVEIVERYGNGIVVPEWGPQALATALNALSADDVSALKAASHAAAAELNADTERAVFLATTGAAAEGSTS